MALCSVGSLKGGGGSLEGDGLGSGGLEGDGLGGGGLECGATEEGDGDGATEEGCAYPATSERTARTAFAICMPASRRPATGFDP